MKTPDQLKSEPELVQISIDGELYYAFKWLDGTSAWKREVNYVFKNSRHRKIYCLLINYAPRIPFGTRFVSLQFHSAENFCESTDFSSATTKWENLDVDNESDVRICSPEIFPDRRLKADLEQMILEYRDGKRQLHQIEKKDPTLDAAHALHALHADVKDIKNNTSSVPGTLNSLSKGVENVRLNTEAIAKNEYKLRQENEELHRLHVEGYLKFAEKIEGKDFTAFVYIMTLGNRKKAADALGIPFRSFYDNVEKWRKLGSEYKRMFRLVEWKKKSGRKIKVRLDDSLMSGEPNDQAENPKTLRDVQAKMKDLAFDNRSYPDILREILDAMMIQNPNNWQSVKKDVIGVLTEELPQ